MKNVLIIQPYGAAAINLINNGNIEILSPIATIIAKNLIVNNSIETIINEIQLEYEFDDINEVKNDIVEFDKLHDYSEGLWEINGSINRLSLVTANIELTLKCELNCKYCYSNSSPKIDTKNELTKKDWNLLIDWLVSNGVGLVTLTGGNPMSSDLFWYVLKRLKENNIYVKLFTNGIGLDESKAERLINNNIVFIEISLDSISPKHHNKYRNNSHSTAIKAIDVLTNKNVYLGIGSCINSENVSELDDLIAYAKAKRATLRFGPMTCHGEAKSLHDSLLLNEDVLANLNKKTLQYRNEYDKVYFDSSNNKYLYDNGRCDFYYGIISINSLGYIKPCLFNDDFFKNNVSWFEMKEKCWEVTDITKTNNYEIIKGINSSYLANKQRCEGCIKFIECKGCLLSGYTCAVNSNN